MNPSSIPNPTPNMNPNQNQPLVQQINPTPTRSASHALSIALIIIVLIALGFVGWKWYSNQQEMKALEAEYMAKQAELENSNPQPSTVETNDALEAEMSLIIDSSSEEDLKTIDGEF